jgi:DNA-binding phage protein
MPKKHFSPSYIDKFIEIALRKGDDQLARMVARHTTTVRFKQKCKQKIGVSSKNVRKALQNKA